MEKTNLLAMIGSVLDDAGIPYEYEEISGRNALVLRFSDDEDTPEDCTLVLDDLVNECTALNYFVIVSTDIDEKTMGELIQVMPDFNLMIRVGGFGLMVDDGVLYFNYSLLTDDLDEENLLKSIMTSLDIVIGVSDQGKKILLPLLKGEKTAEQLMQEDFRLIV